MSFFNTSHISHISSENIAKLQAIIKERTFWLEYKNHQKKVKSFKELPTIKASMVEFKGDTIQIGSSSDLSLVEHQQILEHLQNLIIWRKGPFSLFGNVVDSEWCSNLKWNRLKAKVDIASVLKNKKVLDIGASSGYYMFKALVFDPTFVLGIDPSPHFKIQFETMQLYAKQPKLYYEMLGVEHLKYLANFFEVIFCMGILYHQKSPLEMLQTIYQSLVEKGVVFLETLIISGEKEEVLSPYPSYGKMKNCYFLPTINTLKNWCLRTGFFDIKLISITKTNDTEQRLSQYCPPPAQTLKHFLSSDQTKTVEGYPAPVRVILQLKKGKVLK